MKLYVRQREIAAVGLVLLVASALRGYGLAWQALSGDEALSVLVSAAPLNEILWLMAHGEPYPPLHFLFLKIWMQLAGESELAVRWPSVLASLVTVALIYRFTAYLAETARPDEIVLLNLPDPAFTYYYHAPMPADVPPGEYGIEVGLYQVSTGKRLSLVGAPDAGADAVKLPVTVRVANP